MSILIIPPRNKIEEAMRQASPPARSHEVNPRNVQHRMLNTRRFLLIVLFILIVIPTFVYGSILIYRHLRQPVTLDNNTLIADVGKDIQLPAGETPTIASVTDLAPLKGQEFFKDAVIGDKVLIFSKSGEAILYRPSTKKVIVVAPLNTK